MTGPSPTGAGAPRLSRRRILAGGAALAVASTGLGRLALRGPAAELTLAQLATSAGPRISIGFLDRLADGGPPDLTGRPQVIPAGTARSRVMGTTATARVAGPTPGLQDDPRMVGVHLDALFPHPDGGEPLRHFAWTMRADPLSMSPPTRFVAPIGAMSMGFAMTTFDGSGDQRDASSVMTAGHEQDLPRLRPGTYLLGLHDGIWDQATTLPGPADRAWAELASVAITVTTV